jgi:hypothetical protein
MMQVLMLAALLAAQEPAAEKLRTRYGDRFKDLAEEAAARVLAADDLVGRYIVESDSEKRSDFASRLKEVPIETLAHLLRYGGTGFEAAKPGARLKRRTTLKSGETTHEVELQVTIPADYDPTARVGGAPKRWPLLVGAGNYLLDPAANTFQVQFPYPDLPGGYGRGSHSIGLIVQVVRELRASYPIDDDRVFLTGASAMGHCCWYTAMAHPDLPAGLYTGASMPFPSILNQGRKDEEVVLPPLGQVRHIANYWEYGVDDEGHNPKKYMAPVLKRVEELKFADLKIETGASSAELGEWIKTRSRNRAPARIVFETDEKRISRNHWIEVVDFATRPVFVLQVMHGEDKVERRTMFKKPVVVDAAADRSKNRIDVVADGAKRLRVYLAEELVDLDREIEIVVNGRSTKQKIARSASKLLEATRRAGNRTIPYAAFVEIDVKE